MIRAARPSAYFRAQAVDGLEAPRAEALPGDQTQFDLRLIEPAAVLRGVVDGEAAPQELPFRHAEVIGLRLLAVRVDIVVHQVNGPRGGIRRDHRADHPRERGGGSVGRDTGEVPRRLRFDDAKDVGRPAAAILVIAFSDVPGARGPRRAHVGVQRHRLLVETDDRFLRAARRSYSASTSSMHAR